LPPVPAVEWRPLSQTSGSDNEQSLKPSGKGLFAIYFCSEQLAQTAGLGTVAIKAKIKAGQKPLKDTVFESVSVLSAFKKAGIMAFVKVPATKDNHVLAKKYQVTQDNTLIICAPDGEAIVTLAGDQCNQTNVSKLLKMWAEVYEAWKKKRA